MALKDEFAKQEDFSLQPGTTTLTVELNRKQLVVPWVGFLYAVRTPKKIRIMFHSWEVIISGKRMDELWEGLQQQHLSHVCVSLNRVESACVITGIKVNILNSEDG